MNMNIRQYTRQTLHAGVIGTIYAALDTSGFPVAYVSIYGTKRLVGRSYSLERAAVDANADPHALAAAFGRYVATVRRDPTDEGPVVREVVRLLDEDAEGLPTELLEEATISDIECLIDRLDNARADAVNAIHAEDRRRARGWVEALEWALDQIGDVYRRAYGASPDDTRWGAIVRELNADGVGR